MSIWLYIAIGGSVASLIANGVAFYYNYKTMKILRGDQ